MRDRGHVVANDSTPIRRWMRPAAAGCVLVLLMLAAACRRAPQVSDATYRQAVTSFYVSLAAMQTSQDAHARTELDRLIQLVPGEAAGWANLGLLLLRQQQIDEAATRLVKAAELAPRNAHVQRLLALMESSRGNLDASPGYWRRAIELDPSDMRAPYALALELERFGGAANEAEAQRTLEALATRSRNLAALLEFARLGAKRGDSGALNKALDALGQSAASWSADAQERLKAVRQAAQGNPTGATTPVIFLKNVLIRDPEYRAALAAVSTPRNEVGEPLMRLITLKNPDPQPAPADGQLAFSIDTRPVVSLPAPSWAGAVWLTGDGAPTVVAASPREVRLATGTMVTLAGSVVSDAAGPDVLAAADLNYDFRTDLVFAGAAGLQIFRQGENGAFTNVTADANLPADAAVPLHGVWSADLDTDGDLDLVLSRRDGGPVVLRNNSDNTFAVQTPFASVPRLRGFAWADLDGEGTPDAALLDDQGIVRVFLNLRGSRFRELQVPGGFPRVTAIASAEVSGDGILDLVAIANDGNIARLSRRAGSSTFEAARLAQTDVLQGLAPGASRLLVADLDNNAAADLVISTPSASRVLLGEPGGGFRPTGGALPGAILAAADVDGDGRLDLVSRADDGARLTRTKGQKAYRWQAVRTRAVTSTGDQRINSFGVGGEIEIRSGLHAQKQVIAAPVSHFGLGEAGGAEVARITWPNGVIQSEFDLAASTVIGASQRLKGSCPWLFAWNGKEMSFVTDFIWRSPLGLRINAQATADVLMTEDWVRIRGDQLVPRNGRYDLRITAELWETHFFDLISLLVVDHPAGTEAFVDERFAVPPPKPTVIATAPVQEFRAVHDDKGGDVLDVVRARDDRHLDFAGRGEYQGVTREHYVELELPEEAPRRGPLWFVAQGWVHPTDSSVNVAMGQGKHRAPDGLTLYVADAHGRFRPAHRGLGFPSGKDKTILIDLAGRFPGSGPRRLRLSTNLEIFWDRLGWAVGRPDVKLEPRGVNLESAELRFRGYSMTTQKDPSTPERPGYVLEGVAPRWRDLEGFHTRFGDVRELLEAVDDRYVIMNAGDEIRLTFPEIAPPREGMVRDFVLVGDGWVKDGDYNTTASRTVLPLPTHRSAQYVQGSGVLEEDPVYQRHRADFERYHTRYVSPDGFRDSLRAGSTTRAAGSIQE
jgi:tetratricopeptide (TPR) repeat protein